MENIIHLLENEKRKLEDSISKIRADINALDSALTVLKSKQITPEIKGSPVNDQSQRLVVLEGDKVGNFGVVNSARSIPLLDASSDADSAEIPLSKIPTNCIITQYSVRFKKSDKTKLYRVERREQKNILTCYNIAGEYESELVLKESVVDVCTQVRQRVYNHKTAGDTVKIFEAKNSNWLRS